MRSLTKFFLLTFAITWTCFTGVILLSHKDQTTPHGLTILQWIILFLGTITPSLVALGITAKSGESKTLLDRIGKYRVNIKWYLFATIYMVVIKLAVAGIHHIVTGEWPRFGNEDWYIIIAAVFFSTWVQAGEEIGWRGFALPRMTKQLGLPVATLLLGIIWACWHLPLFFLPGASTFGQSFPLYLLQVIAISVAMGWLYWRTKGSLLLVMLLHAAINNTKDIVPSAVTEPGNAFTLHGSLVAWLTVALLWVAAIYFLFRMRNVKELEISH